MFPTADGKSSFIQTPTSCNDYHPSMAKLDTGSSENLSLLLFVFVIFPTSLQMRWDEVVGGLLNELNPAPCSYKGRGMGLS